MTASVTVPEVWTATPDSAGSDRIYLSQLGPVTGLRYSSAFPGGAKSLSCTLAVDPAFTHRALAPGRDCGVTVGACDEWMGTFNGAPLADDGTRQVTADGDSVTLTRYVALGLGTHNALNPNEVIDAARQSGRHLRFLRDTLTAAAGAQARDAAFTIDEALTQAAGGNSQRWMVDRDRTVRFYPYAGTGEVLHLRSRTDPGRTLDGQLTGVVVAFIDALTGLYRVEHVDASASETGKTLYPNFYLPDLSAYSSRNFTLYLQGSVLTAYVIRAPATADTMHLSSPTATLTRAETSGVYSRWVGTAPGGLAVGDDGATATYTLGGGASLGSGTQDFTVQPGLGSLGATGNIGEREQVVDLTSQGAFTLAQALTAGAAALAKTKVQPHYNGPFTAAPGDLRNAGGIPVDLATVRAGVQVLALVTDPTRTLDLQADVPLVTIGEAEFDADTLTLTLTPAESPTLEDVPRTIDPLTGLAR